MIEPVIVERYRYDYWGSHQKALMAVNARLSELRKQGYLCETVAAEEGEGGEFLTRCQIIRAIRYPEATNIRPAEKEAEMARCEVSEELLAACEEAREYIGTLPEDERGSAAYRRVEAAIGKAKPGFPEEGVW